MLTTVLSPGTASAMYYPSLRSSVLSNLSRYNLLSTYQSMERSSTQAHGQKAKCRFLRDCIDEQVLPQSMSSLSALNNSGNPFPTYIKAAVRDELRSEVLVRENKFLNAREKKRVFTETCPTPLLAASLVLSRRTADYKTNIRVDQHNARLRRLCSESPWGRASLLDCVTNLSSYTLTDTQHQVLGFGLAFALPPQPDSCTDFLVSLNHLEKYASDIRPELRTLRGLGLSYLQNLEPHVTGLPSCCS